MNFPTRSFRPPRIPVFLLGLVALAVVKADVVAQTGNPAPVPLADYGIDVWDGAHGLPHSRIRAVVQTKDGYLWLGTANGLVRFDGVAFTTFDMRSGSLPDNEVSCLLEGNDGTLWIGTQGGGLGLLRDGKFSHLGMEDGLADDSIRRLAEDAQGDLWVATPRGLNRISHGVIRKFTTQDGLSGDFVIAIIPWAPSGVLAVAERKLNRFVGGRFQPMDGVIEEEDGRIDSLAAGKSGDFWVTFETGRVKHCQDGKVSLYTQADHHRPRLGAIFEDERGSVWFAARGGMVRFMGGRFESFEAREPSFRLALALSICEDAEGNLWLGTEANGLARLRSQPVRMLTTDDGLPENSTRCVFRDSRNDIWIGTYRGYARLRDGRVTAFTQMNGQAIPAVTAMGEDASGRLWLGAGGQLLVRENEDLVPVPGWSKVFDIKAIARDGNGHMWVGTDGEGLFEIAGENIKAWRTEEGLVSNRIRAILPGGDGSLWAGTIFGLSRIKDGRVTNLTEKDGLANNKVMFLHEDERGALWITTRGGISRLEGGGLASLHESDGLPDGFIFNLLDDGQGGFWLSSGRGLHHVARADLEARARGEKRPLPLGSLGYREGLRSISLVAGTQPNACRTPDGRFLFCSLGGVVQVTPGAKTVNPRPPPVVVESLSINGTSQAPERVPVIAPSLGEVEIHYTALSFVAPENVRFRYRLEGADAGWTDAGSRRYAHYASLPPGAYHFRVLACNNDGVWNETGAGCRFVLQPHFYQRGWFWPVIVVLVSGLVAAAFWLRLRAQKRRAVELQRRVDEEVARVKVLHGLLPICSGCKKIRNDEGYWAQIEEYIMQHADVSFTHGMCPDCLRKWFPDDADEVLKEAEEMMKARDAAKNPNS